MSINYKSNNFMIMEKSVKKWCEKHPTLLYGVFSGNFQEVKRAFLEFCYTNLSFILEHIEHIFMQENDFGRIFT